MTDDTLRQFVDRGIPPSHGDEILPGAEVFFRSPNNAASEVTWIFNVVEFARSGFLQGIIVTSSIIWLLYRLHGPSAIALDSKTRLRLIKWPYELMSQAARAAAVIFLAFSYIQGQIHMLNFVAVSYAQMLGLMRLADDVQFRRAALHQANFVLVAMLFVLAAAQLLPCVQINTSQCTTDVTILGAMTSLTAAVFIASITPREWIASSLHFNEYSQTIGRAPAPEEVCSWFDYYCTYEWLTPMVWKGVTNKLDFAGIPTLAWYDDPKYLLRKIQKARSVSTTTFGTVLRFQRKELLLMATWAASGASLENAAPFAMFNLLSYIAHPTAATYHPWIWLVIMFTSAMTRSMLFQQYLFVSTRFIVRLKSGMTLELYHRALESMELDEYSFKTMRNIKKAKPKFPHQGERLTSRGRIVNLMAADIDTIFGARDIIIAIFGLPITTVISLVGLYLMMGWASVIGILIMILAAPISVILGRMMYVVQQRVRSAQEGRISMIMEYLSSIRTIKYLAWEDIFINKIDNSRTTEQTALWRVVILQTIIDLSAQALPYIGLLVMFGLHVGIQKRRLSASTAFTSILLVKSLRRNLSSASANSRKFSAAIVALRRIDEYFGSTIPLVRHRIGPLRMKNASFRRNKAATFRLKNISLDFIQGGLNVITGPSGSGKSTLLLAILGETYVASGTLTAPRDVAFASQSPWLQSCSIRDNILFHSPMEKVRYDCVIEACCLTVDLNQMPDGDMTLVGENGASLSGGQIARVALARALYSKSSLVLLDDIFSALDAKTSAEIWKQCFCSTLLNNRTIVLVTQFSWILLQADLTLFLDDGCAKSIKVNIGAVRKPVTTAKGLEAIDPEGEWMITPEANLQPLRCSGNDPLGATDDDSAEKIVNEEMKASGRSGRLMSFQYIKYFGNPILITAILASILSHGSFFISSYWMTIWVEAYEHKAHIDIAYYLGIYALFVFLGTFSAGATIITFQWGGWLAAKKLHNDFIRAVMSAPLSWFTTIPIGRVTNRFSRDMFSIDRTLTSMVKASLGDILTLIFQITAVSSLLPIFILPVLFASALSIILGEMYSRTAVILRRLSSAGRSPIFSHFADTLAGLSVIRAREGMDESFGEALATKLKVWSATAEANYNANRWVAVRVSLATSLISLLAGIIALSKIGLLNAGLVGLSLQNATGLSQSVLALVRGLNDLQIEMQSFHRVKEYIRLKPEEKSDESYPGERVLDEGNCLTDERCAIPEAWPRSGEIEFRNVTVRYGSDNTNALTNVSLKLKAGDRVAVVGRTGSGKTTLILSLLRFTDIVSGQILYDGIDITKIPRRKLRQSVTIIPQEAVLFSGLVRWNLDPTGCVHEAEIEKVLNDCKASASLTDNLAPYEDMVDGSHEFYQRLSLSSEVNAKGENFSHGERQVLSLCRGLIRKSPLILLDEATASMDYGTDHNMQSVIRNALGISGGQTLVTIAHRLRAIMDYDVVIVMEASRITEYGSPLDLFNSRGRFYDMIRHSGDMDKLQELLGVRQDGAAQVRAAS